MPKYDTLKDSGERSSWNTGSVRDLRTGKGRFDLVTPIAMDRLAHHYENGVVKYGIRNWEKGIPLHCYVDSAMRHMNTWLLDRILGREHEEDHLSAIIWNIMCVVHTEEMIAAGKLPKELDDMPGEEGEYG